MNIREENHKRVKSETGDGYIGFGQNILDERKGQRRVERRRAHDVFPGQEHNPGDCGIYGRRSGSERRGEG